MVEENTLVKNVQLPKYAINSFYGMTSDEKFQDKDDFVFVTYKEGLNDKTHMKIIRDTTIPFYVTKPQFRNQNTKRQTSPISELDLYRAQQKDLANEVAKALGVKGTYHKLGVLCQSPYVYNADISSDFLTRQSMYEERVIAARALNMPEVVPPSTLKIGGLDIETSVLGKKEIILISFVTKDFKCYTAIYEPFLKGAVKEDVEKVIEKSFGLGTDDDKIKKYNLTFNLFIGGELECLRWIFDRIHEESMDFLSVWNLDFDIPYIVDRLKFHGEDVKDYFCHPSIPKRYRYFKHEPGRLLPGKHFTEKWPVVKTTAITSYYDSMCLFGRLDKVNGLQNSYGLGYITSKYIKETKLKLAEETTHYQMQSTRFLEYVAYNIWDAVLVVIFENTIKNVPNMLELNGNNSLDIFHKSTAKGKNRYSVFCKKRNEALSTVIGDSTTEYDDEIPALGGNVLNPNKSLDTGVPFFTDTENNTRINVKSADSDAESMYPSIAKTINESKDTAIYTLLTVNGKAEDVEKFCSYYIDTDENAVFFCNEFFNLPDMTEMERLFIEQQKKAA